VPLHPGRIPKGTRAPDAAPFGVRLASYGNPMPENREDYDDLEGVEYVIDTSPDSGKKDDELEIEQEDHLDHEQDKEHKEAGDDDRDTGAEDDDGDGGDDDDEDFGGDVSAKVKKRIGKLTWKLRETERIAQVLAEENRRLSERHKQVSDVAVESMAQSVETKRKDAESRYKAAHEAGDSDALLKAQNDLIAVRAEENRLNAMKAQRREEPAPQQTQRREPDPKALAWAQKNQKWFDKDTVMTAAAYAIDRDLKVEGFDPRSDDFYAELDKRIRDSFPHKFQDSTRGQETGRRTQPRSPVSPGSRTTPGAKSGSRKSVRLSASQVALAKKLGVSLEMYAREVAKMERA
jgi:hypothetical protein